MDLDIWRALFRLFRLIRNEINTESEYQKYFEENPIVFKLLGYDTWASFEKSSKNRLPYDTETGRQHEPDFILGNATKDIAEIFEIKTPFVNGLTTSRIDKREDWKAQITSYFSQARNYKRFISRDSNARNEVCRILGLRHARNVQATLVCGMIAGEDPAFIKMLTDEKDMDFICYDQLFQSIANHYERNRVTDPAFFPAGTFINCGYSICVVAEANEHQNHDPAFIFDTKGETTNPFSLFIKSGKLVFRLTDTEGNEHSSVARIELGKPFALLFEFASSDRGNFFSLVVNGEEQSLQLSTDQIKIENVLEGVLFTDMQKTKFFGGKYYGQWQIPRSLTLAERLEANLHFETEFPFIFNQ